MLTQRIVRITSINSREAIFYFFIYLFHYLLLTNQKFTDSGHYIYICYKFQKYFRVSVNKAKYQVKFKIFQMITITYILIWSRI